MQSLDFFLEFLFKNRKDPRISITKKMKWGCRHYHISFEIDSDPNDTSQHAFSSVDINIDGRNQCIEVVHSGNFLAGYPHDVQYVVEDSALVAKWSQLLEDTLNEGLDDKIKNLFENSLSSCFNKDLYREYQMGKLLPNKESE